MLYRPVWAWFNLRCKFLMSPLLRLLLEPLAYAFDLFVDDSPAEDLTFTPKG